MRSSRKGETERERETRGVRILLFISSLQSFTHSLHPNLSLLPAHQEGHGKEGVWEGGIRARGILGNGWVHGWVFSFFWLTTFTQVDSNMLTQFSFPHCVFFFFLSGICLKTQKNKWGTTKQTDVKTGQISTAMLWLESRIGWLVLFLYCLFHLYRSVCCWSCLCLLFRVRMRGSVGEGRVFSLVGAGRGDGIAPLHGVARPHSAQKSRRGEGTTHGWKEKRERERHVYQTRKTKDGCTQYWGDQLAYRHIEHWCSCTHTHTL